MGKMDADDCGSGNAVANSKEIVVPLRQPGRSALMSGAVGEIVVPEHFPSSSVRMASEKYDYEGNWLFCSFDNPVIRAARIGFGQGRFRWEDYGLDPAEGPGIPLAYRIEVISQSGVQASLFSRSYERVPVESGSNPMHLSFGDGGTELFRMEGWPEMRWRFQSPCGSLAVELQVLPQCLVLWPDSLLPHNTFSMCIGACTVRGVVRIAGQEILVAGGGFYDHPRVLAETNDVAPFGWYLYAPVRFSNGTMIVGYHAEDTAGRIDELYSAAFLTAPGGVRRWLPKMRIRNLRFDIHERVRSWEAEMHGPGVDIRYSVRIAQLSLTRLWTSEPSQTATDQYLAFPLSMAVEGECTLDGVTTRLEQGSGIAECLVRRGYQPKYP
jgi:hypothetical protein